MPSRTIGPNSQHRIASYKKGCKCDSCRAAGFEDGRRRREQAHRERKRQDGDEMCPFCCCWFPAKGLAPHELACRG